MKEMHILNGGAMVDRIVAAGFAEYIVMSECLIDGPVNFSSTDAFFEARANYLSPGNTTEYYNGVVTELGRLPSLEKHTAIYLWFEDDLFCQANMWFVLYYLYNQGITEAVYRIFPRQLQAGYRWNGYGRHTPGDLKEAWHDKVGFTSTDIELGKNLWLAYASGNFEQLQTLAQTPTHCFHDLPDVVQAHIDRFPQPGQQGRPEKLLQNIMNNGVTGFHNIFREFFVTEGGIYGFGDDQVKKILEHMEK